MEQELLRRQLFKYYSDTIVYRKTVEIFILPVQFVDLELLMILFIPQLVHPSVYIISQRRLKLTNHLDEFLGKQDVDHRSTDSTSFFKSPLYTRPAFLSAKDS